METNPNVAVTKKQITQDSKKEEKKPTKSIVDKFRQIIESAKSGGADPSQIGHLRKMMYQYTDWRPTKKRITKQHRKELRKIQKKSRKINQYRQKIQKITKGQIKTGRV